ncbi:glycosyltransferase family 2 protein [Candidatus Cyanaurora vandensis]|uniref:glycosyltransferase family 2 protein n=1 Tax=Candidatus Cyanaurora vandensis TaxID=2714958 RepID=UPI00257EB4EB|nr:glycosyltransferase [Candidatus Cyanaurora vandensis]
MPLISVVICTYNRADRLKLALAGLCEQTLDPTLFEVLVVDNRSTDDTRGAALAYQDQLPLKYHYESVQGLSRARNTGWQAAQGEYVAFLDDDAIPSPVWLTELVTTFKETQPTPVCIGGPIYALYEAPKPSWVNPAMEHSFTVLDYGDQGQWFPPNKFPYGANITYRRDALVKTGGFCEQLGRRGQSLLSCEEEFLNMTLQQQGGGFYYAPQAGVRHWVPQARVNPAWLIRRSYWQGRSEAVAERILGEPQGRQRWQSFWRFRHDLRPKWLVAQVWPNLRIQVPARMRLALRWGYLSQVWFHPAP